MDSGELRFSDLQKKEVINVEDGRRLGNIVDLIFTMPGGQIESFVVPGNVKICDFFKFNRDGITLPWENVCKIGDDVILVRIDEGIIDGFVG